MMLQGLQPRICNSMPIKFQPHKLKASSAQALTSNTKCSSSLAIKLSRKNQSSLSVRAAQDGNPGRMQLRVYVPRHPLVSHWLGIARNKMASSLIFRSAVAELGRLLIYEASNDWLPIIEGQVETPVGIADAKMVDPSKPVKVIPILRAGLVLLEHAETSLPASETYHVGYSRDEETLQPSLYLNKLPATFSAEDRILICDPMLATGGTMIALLRELRNRNANEDLIRVVSVVVAPPALEAISKEFSGVKVYCGMIDEELNEKGFIIPGLGDAGDRAFGNLSGS